MIFVQRLFVIVGTPGSGKDLLIRAVSDLGAQHAQIVPKHTSRARRDDDSKEMIFEEDDDYNLDGCDITYENYEDTYGIESARIWEGLRRGAFQVVVASSIKAINQLRKIFGDLMVLVYVHSEMDAKEYKRTEEKYGGKDTEYVRRRAAGYQLALDIYLRNFLAFDHVLIYSGLKENLFDQIFRLFRAYERGDLHYAGAKPVTSERFWTDMMSQEPPPRIIIGGDLGE